MVQAPHTGPVVLVLVFATSGEIFARVVVLATVL